MFRLIDWFKGKIANAGVLWQVVALGREFVTLIKAGEFAAAEDKAIEILKLFVPAEFAGSVDAFLDSLFGTVINGIALYGEVMKMLGKTANGDAAILVMADDDAAVMVAACEACLAVMAPTTTANEGEKAENPLIIFAIFSLVIQAAEFIIKRRRERREGK